MPLYLSVFLIYGFNNTATSAFSGYIDFLGGDMFLAGLQNSLFIVLAVGLRFVLGPVADRRGARVLLVCGAASFLVPCLALPFCESVGAAIALRVLQAVGLAAYHPNVAFYITELSSREDTARRISVTRFLSILSLMVVPAALFPLADSLGYDMFFAALSLLALAGLLLALMLPREPDRSESGRDSRVRDGRRGFRTVRIASEVPEKALLPLVAMPAALSAGYGAMLVFAPVAASLPGGLVLSLVSTGGMLGSAIAVPLFRRFGVKASLPGFVALFVAGMLGLSLPVTYSAYELLAPICLGVGYFGSTTLLVSALGDRMKAAEGLSSPGSVFSAQQNCLDIGMVLGSVVSGAMLSSFSSASWAFAVWGAVAAAGLVMFCMFYTVPFEE